MKVDELQAKDKISYLFELMRVSPIRATQIKVPANEFYAKLNTQRKRSPKRSNSPESKSPTRCAITKKLQAYQKIREPSVPEITIDKFEIFPQSIQDNFTPHDQKLFNMSQATDI